MHNSSSSISSIDDLHRVQPSPIYVLDDGESNSNNDSSKKSINKPKKPTSKWLIPILYRVQKYSAYSFLSFLGIHLTSVIVVPILPINPEIKNEVFSITKAIYHDIPFFESFVIIGSSLTHILSGIALRIIKNYKKNQIKEKQQRHKLNSENIIKINNSNIKLEDNDDEIGLGGISSIFGLGYRKSFITKYFNLTPLQFSGYLSIPFLIYHFYKFRYIPLSIEGDSSLINLDYVNYVLNLKFPLFNEICLGTLVWVVSYHVTNGILKLNSLYSSTWKKIGLGVVNTIGIMGMISIWFFKNDKQFLFNGNDFVGKAFKKYLNSYFL
ncbi:uncharacterized protein KGF55_005043 [Candida pseudojiufengensis]|uniref:uncharacterized protein n=1 Tax=Candida pseudojiufengensis TaxID=497109 RepID=UPI002224ED6D|nr:uncharacterized protein KGF55_005043 [Candida pseudojiufengensis]KAI5959811.1 hypothetical protein KGF55_005043 [Candida pseudojiufengensis]